MTVQFLVSRSTFGVRNVQRAIDFYTKKLGFLVQTTMGEPAVFAVLVRDGVSLGLVAQEHPAIASFACCYWNVNNVEELYKHCQRSGIPIATPLTRQPWGNHDFVIQDPDGHRIALGEVPAHDDPQTHLENGALRAG
jgi:catechol 2,3-dioxygenase-like lactoylglutathione lyase family enzyme